MSIKIRDCERINLVRELYHDKSRTKELFLAILKHGMVGYKDIFLLSSIL